jgi:hypothetical protein
MQSTNYVIHIVVNKGLTAHNDIFKSAFYHSFNGVYNSQMKYHN